MRKIVTAAIVAALLIIAAPAYSGVNHLVSGVNGVLTAPLDLAAGLVEPHRYFDAKQANVVIDRIGGVVNGIDIFLRRTAFGIVEIVTFPGTELVGGAVHFDARFRVITIVL